MTTLVVSDWEFIKEADVEGTLRAAARYLERLQRRERGMLASLWLRSWQNALRFLHVPVFSSAVTMKDAFAAQETALFAEELDPVVAGAGVRHARCDVVLSSGGVLSPVMLGERGGVVVVNDFTFSRPAGVRVGLEAAARYVERMDERDGMQISLWGRDRERPLRFFHVAAFMDGATAGAAREWPETLEFADTLFPYLDLASFEQTFANVALGSGGELEPEPLRLLGAEVSGWSGVVR